MKGTPTMNFSILLITTFLQRCEEPSSLSFRRDATLRLRRGDPLPSIFTHDTTRQKAEGGCYFVSVLFLFDATRGLLPFLSFLRGEVAFASSYNFFSFLFGATRAVILFCFRRNEVGFPLFSARRGGISPSSMGGLLPLSFHFISTRRGGYCPSYAPFILFGLVHATLRRWPSQPSIYICRCILPDSKTFNTVKSLL